MQCLVTISPDIQSGTPVFAGTRVPVKNFFDYMKGGDTTEEFLHDFPSVSKIKSINYYILISEIDSLSDFTHSVNYLPDCVRLPSPIGY